MSEQPDVSFKLYHSVCEERNQAITKLAAAEAELNKLKDHLGIKQTNFSEEPVLAACAYIDQLESELSALREDALKTVDRMKAYADTVNADLLNALEKITRITQEANTLKIAGDAIDQARKG